MSCAYEACLYLFLLPPSSLAVAAALPLLLLLLIVAALFYPGGLAWSQSSCRSSISGPGGLTIAIALANSTAHRSVAALSCQHAATCLMVFSIGLTRFLISSLPETTREILNSSAFADHPIKESARKLLFHQAMGFAPFGEYWRKLRRISGMYLFLGWMDLQGVRKRCRVLVKKVNVFVGRIIEEHQMRRGEGNGKAEDFVDALLGLEKEEKLSDPYIVVVLWLEGLIQ